MIQACCSFGEKRTIAGMFFPRESLLYFLFCQSDFKCQSTFETRLGWWRCSLGKKRPLPAGFPRESPFLSRRRVISGQSTRGVLYWIVFPCGTIIWVSGLKFLAGKRIGNLFLIFFLRFLVPIKYSFLAVGLFFTNLL